MIFDNLIDRIILLIESSLLQNVKMKIEMEKKKKYRRREKFLLILSEKNLISNKKDKNRYNIKLIIRNDIYEQFKIYINI